MNPVVRNSLVTLSARVVTLLIGLVSGIVVARYLMASGKGVLATINVVVGTSAILANPGLYAANAHFTAKDRAGARFLAGNSIVWGLIAGGAVAAAVFAFSRAFPAALGAIEPVVLVVGLLSVPALILNVCLSNVAIGLERFVFYNVLGNATIFLGFVATVALIVGMGRGVTAVVCVATVFAWLNTAGLVAYVLSRLDGRPAIDLGAFTRSLRYGVPLWLSALMSYLVIRFDMVFVNYYCGAADAGYYSVSVLAVDILSFLPVAVGTVLFPRLSAIGDAEKDALIHRATQTFSPILIVSALALAIAFPILVPLLYGQAFAAAVPAFLWLLPGVVFLGMEVLLVNSLAARGRVRRLPLFWVATALLNVVLTVAFVPLWGVVGAAAASSISYFTIFILVVRHHLRRCGGTARGLLVPTRQSASAIWAEVRQVLGQSGPTA